MSADQTLSATDVLFGESGQVIECLEGQVLVFAWREGEARIPLTSLRPGRVAVGCPPLPSGHRLLFTGLPGTRVRTVGLDELLADGTESVEGWVFQVSSDARAGRWAERVVAPADGESLRLAPGEFVAAVADPVALADQSILGWLSVTGGSAIWCGISGTEISVGDPAVPMTRGTWLTSGLRCRIGRAEPPVAPEQWQNALDVVGRIAISAAVAREAVADAERISRLAGTQERALNDTQEGIDLIVGALATPPPRTYATDDTRSQALDAGFLVARAAGLSLPDEARERAAADVTLGRDPMAAVAQAGQARSREVDLAEQWWLIEGPPLVGRVVNGPWVALSWQRRRWVLIDPADPSTHVAIDAELAATLDRRATEFVPILPAEPQDLRDLLRLSLAGSRVDIVTTLLTTLLVGSFAYVIPLVLGRTAASISNLTTSALAAAMGALILLVVAVVAVRAVRGFAMVRIRARAVTVASGAVWDRIMRLRSTWHDRFTLGERLTQASAVNMAESTVPDLTLTVLLDTVMVVGSLAAAATTTPALFVALAVLLILQLAVSLWLVRIGGRRAEERTHANAAATGRLMETMSAVNRLKVSGAQSRAFRRWAQAQARLSSADLGLRNVATIQLVLIAAWPLLGLVVVVLITSWTGSGFGDFVTAQSAASIGSAAVAAATLAAAALTNARATLHAVIPVLEAVPEGSGEGINPGVLNGDLQVRDVVFRYEPTGQPVLDGVSFHVSPGEHVAIVGPSGCGKTTLMRILLGLEDPESGVIAADGRDLASLDRPSLRRQIGCVLQSASLLPGMLRENVDMGRGLTSAQIWQALDEAAVGDDVRAMALGLDTPVTDSGGTLSGGQRQRVLIARALAGRPRMLILDEATSALDNVTQAAVVESVERLRLTRIVVAHRLSTIRRADRIIVLEQGRVTQEGTFEDLLEQPGTFRELALRQMA